MEMGSPAMVIGYNEDLTNAILLRLPVKSLLRFKTVSKLWLSIVSSDRFRQIHAASYSGLAIATGLFFNKDVFFAEETTKNPELEFLLLDNHTCPIPDLDLPMKILSSSGGLLLLVRLPRLLRHPRYHVCRKGFKPRDYFICNPTTKEIKFLPAVPQVIRDSTSLSANLAFDPSKSLHYKVLFVCLLAPSDPFELKSQFVIYSSETRTFRSLETLNSNTNFCKKGIYWNGAIHWLSHSRRSIYYFDFTKECMNVYLFPPVGNVAYFGESRGNFHTVMDTGTRPTNLVDNQFEVYELKRDYSGWSLKYQVDIDSILNGPSISASSKHISVLSILDDEKEDLTMVLQVRDYFGTYMAFTFNLKKKLYNVLRPRAPSWHHIAYPYKATLALV